MVFLKKSFTIGLLAMAGLIFGAPAIGHASTMQSQPKANGEDVALAVRVYPGYGGGYYYRPYGRYNGYYSPYRGNYYYGPYNQGYYYYPHYYHHHYHQGW